MSERIRGRYLIVLLAAATAGCGQDSVRKQIAREAPLEGTPRARRQQLEKAGVTLDSELRKIDELTQHENGPGLVVCEPVVLSEAAPLRDFGRGCARWLQFETAGQGSAGKSPLWWSAAFAHSRLEDRKLQPTPEHAVTAMGQLGATHVAVGEIQGTKDRATLTYRLYAVSGSQAVGKECALTGSLNEIRQGLPATAEQLARDAGLTSAKISPSVLEAVGDLEYLGSLDREGCSPYANYDSPRLAGLAERSPLASVYRVMACSKATDWQEIRSRCQQLVDRAPENAAGWGVVATAIRNCEVGAPHPQLYAPLERILESFPRNLQLSLARAQLHMARKEWKQARAWNQEAARCNTRASAPFELLAGCIRSENQVLSLEARSRGGLTREESERIWTTNTRRLELFQHAAKLNPTDGEIWEMVSASAVLQRNRPLAEEALKKAVECSPRSGRPYWWGIDMYNPGHLNDPQARARFAEIAASAPLKRPEERIYTAQLLHHRKLRGADGRLPMRVLRTDHERKQVTDWIAGKPVPWGGNPPGKKETPGYRTATVARSL